MLRDMAEGRSHLEVEVADGGTLTDLWAAVALVAPGLRNRVLDQHGPIRPHVNVFVNAVSAREIGGEQAALADGDEVWVLAAVSGGCLHRPR